MASWSRSFGQDAMEDDIGGEKEREMSKRGSVRLKPPEGAANSFQSIVWRLSEMLCDYWNDVVSKEAETDAWQ